MNRDRPPQRPQSSYALVLLLATAAALVAVALTGERSKPAPRPGEELDATAAAELAIELTPEVASRIAQMRGLEFEEVPLPRVITGERLSEIAEDDFRERVGDPVEVLAADTAIARIVGLLEPGADLLGLVEGTGDFAAAVWDTREQRLYVVAEAAAGGPATLELFLAHELVHALEDQAFGLPEPDPDAEDDATLAERALIEGTATALMDEYATRYIDPLALGSEALGLDPGTEGLPDFAVEQLEWTYFDGAEFVERLYELGGGWDLIDNALESRPPESSEQILHPLSYVRDEGPHQVAIRSGGELRAGGWERADTGALGELATRQLLALGVDDAEAERAAEGWGGDRYELWTRGVDPIDCEGSCREDQVLVIRWRWDTPADAAEFRRAARTYVEEGLGGEPAGDGVSALGDGWVEIAAEPGSTSLTFAPSRELARTG